MTVVLSATALDEDYGNLLIQFKLIRTIDVEQEQENFRDPKRKTGLFFIVLNYTCNSSRTGNWRAIRSKKAKLGSFIFK